MDVKARSSRTRGPIWTLEVVIGGHCYRLLTHVFEVLIKLPPPKVISGLLSNIQKGGPLLRNSWSLSIWTFGDTLMSSEISAIRHEELFLLRHVDSKKIVQILRGNGTRDFYYRFETIFFVADRDTFLGRS